jgi:hypothetical protein
MEMKHYYYLVAYKESVLSVYFLDKIDLSDILELALLHDGHEVTFSTIRGYIAQDNLHQEEDLMKYKFYSDYVNNFIYNVESISDEEIL